MIPYNVRLKKFGWSVHETPTHIWDNRLGRFKPDAMRPMVYTRKHITHVVRTLSQMGVK